MKRRRALIPLLASLLLLAIASEAHASGYANAVLADHPQLYWRLGEPSDTGTAADVLGQHPGSYLSWDAPAGTAQPRTPSPVASALPADPDRAQAFPSNTYVESTPLPASDTGAIEFWLRWTAGYPPGFANMFWRTAGPPPSSGYWSIRGRVELGEPGILLTLGDRVTDNYWLVGDGTWHHYVVRWNATTIEQWRDAGLVVHYGNSGVTQSPAGERIRIGNVSYDGRTDTGAAWEIDEFATYADLPRSRIAAHYEARNAPTNLVPPSISTLDSSAYQRGAQLKASMGEWTLQSSDLFHIEWSRCRADGTGCVPISGATSDTYKLQGADVGQRLRLDVSAVNGSGSDSASSELTPVIRPLAPVSQTKPDTSATEPIHDGDTVLTSAGTWGGDPPDRYDYAWLRCDSLGTSCDLIPGAVGYAYTATEADVDRTLRARVTATNDGGSNTSTTDATSRVLAIPPSNQRLPAVQGMARDGELVVGADGEWRGSRLRLRRAWLRCANSCAQIRGVSDTSYQITRADIGYTLRYEVTASNGAGDVTAVSEPVGPVSAARDAQLVGSAGQVVYPGTASMASATEAGPQNGWNVSGKPGLSIQFTSNSHTLDSVPFGQGAIVSGRLTNERDEPITDAAITVEERSSMGSDFRLVAEVLSDKDGVYTVRLGPGPSRIVRASYRAYQLDRDPAASAQAELAVAATGRLESARRRLRLGDEAVFRGRLAGEPFPTNGIPVSLQAKDGPRWSEVARGRSARDGTFEFRYRFCRTVRSYTYGFRVSIGQTAGWPYDPGATNTAKVNVRVPRRVSTAVIRKCR
jgi:hypothetical protein